MRKILTFAALVFVTACAAYIVLHDHFTGRFPWSQPKVAGIIQTKIHSAVLNEDRDIVIHLPPRYDSTKNYPVMYVLDGSSEDQHIAEKFDILSTAGCTPQAIVVGIPNMTDESRQRDLTPPFMKINADDNASPPGEADRFLLFMESELIPFIEHNYRASPVRLITGNSRGGLLVMYSLLYKPELFQARFCYSAPLWRQENILVSKVADFLQTAGTLPTFLYMSAGANETENIKNGLELMTKAFQEKAPTGLTWHSEVTSNATHQTNARISAAAGIGRWGAYVKTGN